MGDDPVLKGKIYVGHSSSLRIRDDEVDTGDPG